jgi:AcrR family transcriptional regulator
VSEVPAPVKRPRGRPRTLSRARVIATALEIARDEGLEAASLRGVARRLGMRETSLYTYVSSKDDLLAGMLDAVFSDDIELPRPGDDRPPSAQVKAIFRELRRRALDHRELVGLLGRIPAVTPAPLRTIDCIASLLSRMGLSPLHQATVYTLLHQVTVAAALTAANKATDGREARVFSLLAVLADRESYPALASLIEDVGTDALADDSFELLLGFVLDDVVPALATSDNQP